MKYNSLKYTYTKVSEIINSVHSITDIKFIVIPIWIFHVNVNNIGSLYYYSSMPLNLTYLSNVDIEMS